MERQTSDPFNPWQTSQATYSADNKVLTATDPQGNVTTMTYDNLQRLWKVTDSLSRVVERIYDDANRISSIKDPTGTTAVTYTYRDNGGLSTLKDARNYVTTYTVDGHDRADKVTYPDSTYEQITSRDGNSNPLTVVSRSGATTTLTYDELNRVKTKAPASQPTVTTVYDIAGRVVTVSTPTVAGDPASGTFTNYYDGAGRFYKEQYPDGLTVIHDLDANGNVTKTTYPDGYYVQRVFDQLNRLTDIKLNGAGTSAVQFEYDALSRRTKLTYENGCSTSYGFEVDNDMNLLYLNFVGSSVGFNYGFDNASQMSKQGTTDPANYRWTPGSPATTTYATANNMNQYGTVGGTSFTYSTDGSLTNDGVNKYEYNTERMLTRVRNAGTNAIIADYLYDPGLRQRQKNVGGTKTNYYYAGWQRLADYDGTTNTLQTRYVYGTGLDEVLISVTSSGTKTYSHANHQGSVVAKTNSAGAVTNTYKYSPFGESSSLSGISHGYTGQRPDPETGLYYYKMRHYSPRLGRFLQADPIGYAAGLNMYAYCGNAPTQATDPMGLTDGYRDNGFPGVIGVQLFGGGGGSKSAGPAGGGAGGSGGAYGQGGGGVGGSGAYRQGGGGTWTGGSGRSGGTETSYGLPYSYRYSSTTKLSNVSVDFNRWAAYDHPILWQYIPGTGQNGTAPIPYAVYEPFWEQTGNVATLVYEGRYIGDWGVWVQHDYSYGPTHQVVVVGQLGNPDTWTVLSFAGSPTFDFTPRLYYGAYQVGSAEAVMNGVLSSTKIAAPIVFKHLSPAGIIGAREYLESYSSKAYGGFEALNTPTQYNLFTNNCIDIANGAYEYAQKHFE